MTGLSPFSQSGELIDAIPPKLPMLKMKKFPSINILPIFRDITIGAILSNSS